MGNYKKPQPRKIEFLSDEQLLLQQKIEDAVLGQIILSSESIYLIGGDLSESLFNNEQNKLIAKAIIQLFSANKKIDLLTVVSQLKANNDLEEAGGVSKVSGLTSGVGSGQNIEVHLKLLQQDYLARYIISVCEETKARIVDNEEDVFDIYDSIQKQLEDAMKTIIRTKVSTVGEIHEEVLRDSILIGENGAASGVPTGLSLLDASTNGFQPSDLIILAGRPSMGKTAAAISMIMYPAIEQNKPVGIFSLEMSKEQLTGRIQAALSRLNVGKIINKQLTGAEILILDEKCKDLKTAPIYIDDSAAISIPQLKVKARQLVREHGVEMIIVDYLQLMKSGLRHQNREQEIAEISRGLKIIAKDLNIPIIALSQLSRNVEQRGGDKKPQLSDLRESGQIEQDADMIMFCYRPEYYGFTDYELMDNVVDSEGLFLLLIAKHRNGSLGDIPLRFVKELAHVTNHPQFMPYNMSNQQRASVNNETPSGNLTTLEVNGEENFGSFLKSSSMRPNDEFDTSREIDFTTPDLNDPANLF